MAEVVPQDHHNRHVGRSIGSMTMSEGVNIEMISNPDFSFTIQRQRLPFHTQEPLDELRRPASRHINLSPPISTSHKRAASTLPSFTFNASDTSGRQDAETPPETPVEDAPATPSQRGHRRGGSEFVGGDSRLGVSSAVSSSPTKTNVLPLPVPSSMPSPGGRRGHAHRRSAAISSHDLSSIIPVPEVQPRLSSSLPSTPLEHPLEIPPTVRSLSTDGSHDISDPFGPKIDDTTDRPPSRPRVGFAENVEYIPRPRPLSTISSETESSISTRQCHSLNNSISSILNTPSPPSSRTPGTSINMPEEEAPMAKAKSSLEMSKRLEKEGEWLKNSSTANLKRPVSESAMVPPKSTFVTTEAPARNRAAHNKKLSLTSTLGFDRRRSEPAIGMNANEQPRLSAVSLQEPPSAARPVQESQETHHHEHFASAKRIKQWAASKISRKTKDMDKAPIASGGQSSLRPDSNGSAFVPETVEVADAAVAETNLDTVFGNQTTISDLHSSITPARSSGELKTPALSQRSSYRAGESDEDLSTMLDLDAALGPFKTPPIGTQRQRKELHSSRLTKDFNGPGGHYHRRTESAPDLAPFEFFGSSTPTQSSMADVFEEEEENEADEVDLSKPLKPISVKSAYEEEASVGVQVVDSDQSVAGALMNCGSQEGLGIVEGDWEPERPTTGYGNVTSRFSAPALEPRAASIIEETIMEEAGSGETIDIVEAHEEPRASSLTKSSDSSETPTLLAPQPGFSTLPDGQKSIMTPETYQTSAFSSPDFGKRQSSFDTSRLGTSASSITDNRTMSSCATGEHVPELRVSVDDVPSLTSSRSTMLSSAHANGSRRDFAATRTASSSSGAGDPATTAKRRSKRSSIQSLSQLMGGSFGSKSRGLDESRPHTAAEPVVSKTPKRKEHRLKKLMFWKSKQYRKQSQQLVT